MAAYLRDDDDDNEDVEILEVEVDVENYAAAYEEYMNEELVDDPSELLVEEQADEEEVLADLHDIFNNFA